MANPNNPFGFQILKTEGKENRVTEYLKSAVALYAGDAVKMTAAGVVAVAAAGDIIIGVVAEYAAAAAAKVAVYDDPEAIFKVQMSGVFAAADVGLNANIIATAGDASLLRSKQSLDTATQDVTATLQFKIVGLLNQGENAVGAQAIVRVKPNSHFFKAGTAGI